LYVFSPDGIELFFNCLETTKQLKKDYVQQETVLLKMPKHLATNEKSFTLCCADQAASHIFSQAVKIL
jgi:hypothetical protein